MFEKTLVKGAKDALALLGQGDLLSNSYLAGGTALALQLGHRVSVDFDFFTTDDFTPRIISQELSKLGQFKEIQADKGSVFGDFKGVKFSLFTYQYPIVFPLLKYLDLRIADIRDIAAMKIDAISSRGLKRDFVDMFFICQSGHSLNDVMGFYQKKYGKLAFNFIHIQKSLVFFGDADPEEMPKMLKLVRWKEINKEFFL